MPRAKAWGFGIKKNKNSIMPKSLDEGPSAIVPVRAPKKLRDELRQCLRDGEDVSSLTRELWQREIAARAVEAKSASQKKRKSS